MSFEPDKQQVADVKISQLQPYQNRFRVAFKIVQRSETREVNNRDNPSETHKISDITVADDTGSMILTAWDDDIDLLQEGKFFKLENGYINVFRDSMRLSRGKFGVFTESTAVFEPNLTNNRSEEIHERRPRRRYGGQDRGAGRGYGGDRGSDRDNF